MKYLKDSKPYSRRVLVNTDNRIEPRASDFCTMTIYPSGSIGFRANRSKNEIFFPISTIYKSALIADMIDKKAKRKTHKVNRGLLHTFGIK